MEKILKCASSVASSPGLPLYPPYYNVEKIMRGKFSNLRIIIGREGREEGLGTRLLALHESPAASV